MSTAMCRHTFFRGQDFCTGAPQSRKYVADFSNNDWDELSCPACACVPLDTLCHHYRGDRVSVPRM
ncbi:hypothetical protein J6590_085131 [Homalodisca vitripennis]|nr:hypothetical protein J6590_085131 [Homalodisca vitripennis]